MMAVWILLALCLSGIEFHVQGLAVDRSSRGHNHVEARDVMSNAIWPSNSTTALWNTSSTLSPTIVSSASVVEETSTITVTQSAGTYSAIVETYESGEAVTISLPSGGNVAAGSSQSSPANAGSSNTNSTACPDIGQIDIQYWDLFCQIDSIFNSTAVDSSSYLGEISLNWTLEGLEDALLEAVQYAYDNYLDDFITALEELPSFSIQVYNIDEFNMNAIFFSSAYNLSGVSLDLDQDLRRRDSSQSFFILQYNSSSASNQGIPALAGYKNVNLTSLQQTLWPGAKYIFDNTSRLSSQPSISKALDVCVEYYTQSLVKTDSTLRAHALTMSIMRVHHDDGTWSVSCGYNPGLFFKYFYHLRIDAHATNDLTVYERTSPCVFNTNLVQDPPECLWTEYGSKIILEAVAANVSDSHVSGFFDSFMIALGSYINDGQQGIRMDCDLVAGCSEPSPPSASATDKQVAGFMITSTIYQHYTACRQIFEAFTLAKDWATGVLPGIVDILKIPQTQEQPEEDSLDFFGLFQLVLGYTPIKDAAEALGDAVDFFTYMSSLQGTPIPSTQYPTPNLFQISVMLSQTLTLVQTSYIDAFAAAVGSQKTTTRRQNFTNLFDWHRPPSLVQSQQSSFTAAVETIKPVMIDFIMARTFEATRIPLMKIYAKDLENLNFPIDFNMDLAQSGQYYNSLRGPGGIPSNTTYNGTDSTGGAYNIQALVYHHWDLSYTSDETIIRETSSESPEGEIAHFGYRALENIRDQLSQYWSPERIFTASIECQMAKTNGQFPQSYNGKKFYPQGVRLDVLTDVNNIGACTIWNTPVCATNDEQMKTVCDPDFANTHEGYYHGSDNEWPTNLQGVCRSSYFEITTGIHSHVLLAADWIPSGQYTRHAE